MLQRSRLFRFRAAEDQYEEIIENPSGKEVEEWAWDQVLWGMGRDIGDDSSTWAATLVTFTKPVLVKDADGTTWTFMGFIATEHERGLRSSFVHFDYYPTIAEANAAFEELEADLEEGL